MNRVLRGRSTIYMESWRIRVFVNCMSFVIKVSLVIMKIVIIDLDVRVIWFWIFVMWTRSLTKLRLGQPGVDIHVRHDIDGPPGSTAVLHLQFLVNEGALVSATADDSLHLWNFRQKVPQIVQSLKFQKEKWVWIFYAFIMETSFNSRDAHSFHNHHKFKIENIDRCYYLHNKLISLVDWFTDSNNTTIKGELILL